MDTWERVAASFDDWRRGVPGAIDELITQMTPVLWHVVRAYGLSQETSEDVIQHTWLTLVKHSESIDSAQAVGAWLLITARREAWRRSARDRKSEARDDEQLSPLLPDAQSAETDVLTNDANTHLWNAVNQLSPRCQRLLRVIAFDDRPNYKVLAEDLGLAVGSIGATRRRCLDGLKKALGESEL